MPLTPDIQRRLEALESDALRLKLLQEQADALSTESDTARKALRRAFKERHDGRFKAFDYRMALTGAPVIHVFTAGPVAFHLTPPTAATSRAAEALTAGDSPANPSEAMVCAWLVALVAEGQAARDIRAMPLKDRLPLVRALPEFMVNRIAEECGTLQAWLTTTLEIELGN